MNRFRRCQVALVGMDTKNSPRHGDVVEMAFVESVFADGNIVKEKWI